MLGIAHGTILVNDFAFSQGDMGLSEHNANIDNGYSCKW